MICRTGTYWACSKPRLHFFSERNHTGILYRVTYGSQFIPDYLSRETDFQLRMHHKLFVGGPPPGSTGETHSTSPQRQNRHKRKGEKQKGQEKRWEGREGKVIRCHTGSDFFKRPALGMAAVTGVLNR